MQHTNEQNTDGQLYDALAKIVGCDAVLTNEPMSKHTTFQVGGPADLFVSPPSVECLIASVQAIRDARVPLWVVGCGSNLLVSDKGLRGVVVHVGEALSAIEVDQDRICVQAGATNEALAHAALDAGLTGYEFASGIPGSVGGAAVMNAGAYDGEFKDVCTAVTCLTPEGELVEVTDNQADWGYRHSMMMDRGWIVVSAVLQLAFDNRDAIRERMDDLAQRRSSKQPLDVGSAGSTFKRPEGYFAGALIQQAGMQGHRVGGAMVSTKHAGFVVNMGGATAADVLQVISDVQQAVRQKSGVSLEPEVRLWGF